MNDIIYYLDKLTINTSNGKIPWIKLNDGVFVWQTETTNNVKTNVILQKTTNLSNFITNILFRLYEVDNKKVILDINTKESNIEIITAVEKLFTTIENSQSNYELNVLDDLIKKLE